jgi:hypothetical protein
VITSAACKGTGLDGECCPQSVPKKTCPIVTVRRMFQKAYLTVAFLHQSQFSVRFTHLRGRVIPASPLASTSTDKESVFKG